MKMFNVNILNILPPVNVFVTSVWKPHLRDHFKQYVWISASKSMDDCVHILLATLKMICQLLSAWFYSLETWSRNEQEGETERRIAPHAAASRGVEDGWMCGGRERERWRDERAHSSLLQRQTGRESWKNWTENVCFCSARRNYAPSIKSAHAASAAEQPAQESAELLGASRAQTHHR